MKTLKQTIIEATKHQMILIVDSRPESLEELKDILKDFNIVCVSTGKEALRIAHSEIPPDLILVDLMVADIDGFEICEQIKEEEKTKEIPLIFISSKNNKLDEAKAFELGAVDFIPKPVFPPVLRARITSHLSLIVANKQLESQNKLLMDAARFREEVEHISRHDLKNPLSLVLGFSQTLIDDFTFNDQAKEFLRLINEAGYRMLDIVNRSIDLFMLERGAYELRPKIFNIIQLVKNLLRDYSRTLENTKTSVTVYYDEKVSKLSEKCEVIGEELLFYSMLSNLLKNAIEASPRGGEVVISITNKDEVDILIKNKGEVPEEIRGHFFRKYVTHGKRGASGLGAYAARLITEVHRGKIKLDTSEKGYTSILIRIPRY
jgi:signal transduction histidine kinase